MSPISKPPEDVRDRVMWLFALIAGFLLTFGVVLISAAVLFRPDTDLNEFGKALNTQVSLIVGAVLGYAARGPSSPPSSKGDSNGA